MGIKLFTGNELTVTHEVDRVILKDSFGTVGSMTQEEAIELANCLLDAAGKIR